MQSALGLTLTDTMLMVPFKSVTAVIGVTDAPTMHIRKVPRLREHRLPSSAKSDAQRKGENLCILL